MTATRWVGRDVPQLDLDAKLAGTARYIADMEFPGLLHAAIARSRVPHGRIRAVHTEKAHRVPGVRAVVTANQLGHESFGPYTPDWEILARDKVRFIGDEIAAVAAVTPEAAREAADLIEFEIEELPAVFDATEALTSGAPVLWDERPDNISSLFTISRGDVDGAFRRAAHVVEGVYTTNRIYHAYLEPIGMVASYEAGTYILNVPTHIPYRARLTYAAALGVSLDRVRIVVPTVGGSFGAKYEMNTPLIAAVLARETGAPVRILFDREEDAAYAHPRPPFVFRNRIAVAADGRFLARETDVIGTAGARTYWAPTVVATAVHRVDSLYRFEAMSGIGRLVYTNENPTTCMRGFGNAEALFGFEQMVDEVAAEVGMDPAELRLLNAVAEGETTLHGWYISSSRLPSCVDRARDLSGWDDRGPALKPEQLRAAVRAGDVLRGKGMAIAHHVSGYRAILPDFDGSSAILRLGGDGAVRLLVGEPDIGQGQSTVLAQLVADRLGIDLDQVRVDGVDSAFSPAAVGTLASRSTTMAGQAVLAAADDAVAKVCAFLAEQWAVGRVSSDNGVFSSPDSAADPVSLRQALAEYAKVNCGLPLLAQGVHRPNTVMPDGDKYGNPSAAYPFAAHVAEVEVDCATGQVRVVEYWAVHDSGTIINPATARSQVLGGIAQGVGWALMEDVVSRDGRVANPNFLDYRIPGAGDMPGAHVEFVAGHEPNGPMGAKSLGEVAINPVVPAIANAIHQATGIRCHDLPITPEKLWQLISEAAS